MDSLMPCDTIGPTVFCCGKAFFTSLPWGIVFVFLNDFLSQEKGFSVPDATFMVMLFGIGCAIGGIFGGYIGQVCMKYNRSYLPLFMAVTTFLGIFPFVGLLNSEFPDHHGYKAMGYSILGGCLASLPSVNVRPCIINVNPPETRGAALTAANLLITLGRGIGPSCITLMGSLMQVSRQTSFTVTLTGFWTITAIQLCFLVKTLPEDQDDMEAELARYAAALKRTMINNNNNDDQENSGIETTLLSRDNHNDNDTNGHGR
jgi:predicted MFS family arabinose efflux permease